MSDIEPLPPIGDIPDDIWTQQQVAAFLAVTIATVRDYMSGRKGVVKLPYVRIGGRPLFSKRQIAWWLRRTQEQVDVAMVDVQRARRELS